MRTQTLKELGRLSAPIDAPVEAVWAALLDQHPYLTDADRRTIEEHGSGSPLTFTVTAGYSRVYFEVDPVRPSIAIAGEWWYCGEYVVEQDGSGSRLVYRFFNIAPPITRWMADLVQVPDHRRTMGAAFEGMCHAIEAKVGFK